MNFIDISFKKGIEKSKYFYKYHVIEKLYIFLKFLFIFIIKKVFFYLIYRSFYKKERIK